MDSERLTAIVERTLTDGQHQQVIFGEGVAEASSDQAETWRLLVEVTRHSTINNPSPFVLQGFLRGVAQNEPSLVEKWLDAALDEPKLVQGFLALQLAVPLNHRGCTRLIKAVRFGGMPIGGLGQIGRDKTLSDDSFASLLLAIIEQENGSRTALELVRWRYGKDQRGFVSHASLRELIAGIWCDVFIVAEEDSVSGMSDHRLAYTMPLFLGAGASEGQIDDFSTFFAQHAHRDSNWVHAVRRTLRTFAKLQPDAFFDSTPERQYSWRLRRLREFGKLGDVVDDDVLIRWCERDTGRRHENIALIMPLFEPIDRTQQQNAVAEEGGMKLTSLARRIVDSAPDVRPILAAYRDAISPNSGSGSRAEIIAGRIDALGVLLDHPNTIVREIIADVIDEGRELETAQRAREAVQENEQQRAFE